MKKLTAFCLALLMFLFSCCSLVACNNRKQNANDELEVINVFQRYASVDSDGNYRFSKYDDLGNVSFVYGFYYNSKVNSYYCGLLVTTYGGVKLYDHATVTFSWGNFDKGYFYAYHELDSVAIIEFEFSKIKYNKLSTSQKSYSYKVTKNTFSNLTAKEDIKEYADELYDCLAQAVSFARTTLRGYGLSVEF